MDKRRIGNSTIETAPLVFGGNVFGWTVDEATSFSLLDAFVDAGFSAVDTADVYSRWVPGHRGGESETMIGNWIARRGRSDDIVVVTKVGMDMGEDRSGLRRDHIMRSVEESLSRLKRDHVDVYMAHRDDPDTPLDETLAAFDALVREGRVAHVGLSNYSPARIRLALDTCDAHGLTRPSVVQPPYSLVARAEFEGELQELCAREGLAVATYAALAAGFLTGKYTRGGPAPDSARARGVAARFGGEDAWAALEALLAVARERDAEPAAVAVAWVMAQPGVTSAIASATSVAQLDTLLAAADLELTGAELARLSQTER